jgi:predicted nucleotide-binding protein (sugar kinase/HSP70/actin superfamily)
MKKERAIFSEDDKSRTIIVPWFSEFYSPFAPVLGKLLGYKIESLPPSNNHSINLGLEYANNEICYPATLVVGDIIRALKSNQYKAEEIAVGITQTGGQCRATNYISIIKRAMESAGFNNVPIVALAPSDSTFNNQPGFTPNWIKIIKPVFLGLLFADSISRLYYATASREQGSTNSKILKDKYLLHASKLLEIGKEKELLSLLAEAIVEFNNIPITNSNIKTVGIVGEIYIKYNAFGQFNIIDWLVESQVEVVLPPLMEFFMQTFVNTKEREKDFINRKKPFGFANTIIERIANNHISKFEKKLTEFRFYRRVYNIRHSAQLASEILSLNNQYGEGWLIPAEIASFSNQNINDIICIQPFGCLANHIVGKGMELKIKSLYPDVNLLYLDFDSGMSKVNILNRLHFLVQNNHKTTTHVA